jgi:predicted membrane channel-forming protein YqfA (hemolysin III family)
MKKDETNQKTIISLKRHRRSLLFGVLLLFLDLPFWFIFVEGNRDYGSWTRTVAIIIFVTSIVLFIFSKIFYDKAKMHE